MPFLSADTLLSLPKPSNELVSFGWAASPCQLQLDACTIRCSEWKIRRTGSTGTECTHPCAMALFILSADLSHTFIAGGKKDDGGEREQKGDGTRNAPLTENNAEIVSGPREEHLSSQS
jgi:hypothetical protein